MTPEEPRALISDDWSNNACLGYTVKAAERIGLDKKTTTELLRAMKTEFEITSVEDAKRYYEEGMY